MSPPKVFLRIMCGQRRPDKNVRMRSLMRPPLSANNLNGTDTLSGETNLSKVVCLPSEKGPTLKK